MNDSRPKAYWKPEDSNYPPMPSLPPTHMGVDMAAKPSKPKEEITKAMRGMFKALFFSDVSDTCRIECNRLGSILAKHKALPKDDGSKHTDALLEQFDDATEEACARILHAVDKFRRMSSEL